jgi:hypothetical protein
MQHTGKEGISVTLRHSFDRCHVLGLPADPTSEPAATMIVPARPEQRLRR